MNILGNWIINAAPSFDGVKKAVKAASFSAKNVVYRSVGQHDISYEEVDIDQLPEGLIEELLNEKNEVIVKTDDSEE